MSCRLLFAIAILSALSLPGGARAFDGRRTGFMMGLGVGYGRAEFTQQAPGEDVTASGFGPVTGLRLGFCSREQVWIFYSNRVLFFEGDDPDDRVQGATGLGVAWIPRLRGLPLHLTAEAGVAVHLNRITQASAEGFGFAAGAGLEFRKNWVLEFHFLRASVQDDPDPRMDLQNLSVSIGWVGY